MKYLRFVTWLLPDKYHTISGTRRDSEWERAVDICAQEGNLQLLSFTIDLSIHAHRRRASGAHYHSPIPIARLEEYEWNTGLLLVESMARYKSWKNVYVHLSWPWHNPHNPNDPYSCPEEAQDLRECHEAVLEEQVMGPGNIYCGKYDRRHSWNGYICNYEDNCEQCEDED
jgi:hypothetical protein